MQEREKEGKEEISEATPINTIQEWEQNKTFCVD